MKKLNNVNINTPDYFDSQFSVKKIDFENTLRQSKYLELIGEGVETVIEVGCGMSAFCPMAMVKYPNVWGLDFAQESIERLREVYTKVQYVVGDALNTPFKDKFFDAVVAGEIIEHFEEPQKFVDELVRICKPGGRVILSTPHLEFNDPEHLWEFEEQDLHDMFSKYGTTTVETIKSDKFLGRSYLFLSCQLSQ